MVEIWPAGASQRTAVGRVVAGYSRERAGVEKIINWLKGIVLGLHRTGAYDAIRGVLDA